MEYRLTYKSTNIYERPTPDVYLDFLILPAETDDVKLQSLSIRTAPKSFYTTNTNMYGFKVLRFMHLTGLKEFTLEMECIVTVEVRLLAYLQDKDKNAADHVLKSDNFRRRNYFYLRNTALTMLDGETLKDCARQDDEPVWDYVQRLKDHVHGMMEYVSGVTDITTTAQECLVNGKGVCQDFTHVFLGYCRSAGIPSRYVSGYLHVGSGQPAQLHAWAETLVPGLGWIGIDPTNHLLTNENYIKIAHGTDYSECPSIRGIIRGVIDHTTIYEVSIQQRTQ